MRVVVIADSVGSAEGFAGLATQLGHEGWLAVGAASAMVRMQEAHPDAALVALDAESSVLRAVIERARAVSPGVPIVLALRDDSWWLRSPPGGVLAPVATVRRTGLSARTLSNALARLGVRSDAREAPDALRLDGTSRHLEGAAGRRRLTPAEGALLARLLDAAGAIVPHEELARAVWGDGPLDRARMVALRTHMYELRRKLAAVGGTAALLSEPGRGYRLATS
ncbi:MAG: winged helix-turn-helix domain-containing protein [Dehalococcoidia bacterium]|nr:winged helix-turn-helix domain-containing protein [Dehalococcoidia bacterium]